VNRKTRKQEYMMLLIVIYSLWIYLGLFVEGKLICSPDRTNGRCQWTLFRWNKSDGCGYKQKQNERKLKCDFIF